MPLASTDTIPLLEVLNPTTRGLEFGFIDALFRCKTLGFFANHLVGEVWRATVIAPVFEPFNQARFNARILRIPEGTAVRLCCKELNKTLYLVGLSFSPEGVDSSNQTFFFFKILLIVLRSTWNIAAISSWRFRGFSAAYMQMSFRSLFVRRVFLCLYTVDATPHPSMLAGEETCDMADAEADDTDVSADMVLIAGEVERGLDPTDAE
jgi:hypothetical protein